MCTIQMMCGLGIVCPYVKGLAKGERVLVAACPCVCRSCRRAHLVWRDGFLADGWRREGDGGIPRVWAATEWGRGMHVERR